MHQNLNPSFTFASFVVGSGNRLAVSAARRSAESPGANYNPLVIHGPTGMGKTHLLHALANDTATNHPFMRVCYEPMSSFVDRLSSALSGGRMEQFRKECVQINLLLLDDAQFLTGSVRTQNELLPIWDAMGRNGAQVVLASDRSPVDMDRLDMRLTSRFARGLVVDIAPPDVATRTAMVLHKAEERGIRINDGVAPALARLVSGNIRDLEEALDHVVALQEHRGAAVVADEVAQLLGVEETYYSPAPAVRRMWPVSLGEGGAADDDLVLEDNPFAAFLSDITETVAEVVESEPWRTVLGEAILRWGGEGIRTWRLEAALAGDSVPEVGALIEEFEADATRLIQIGREVADLDPTASGASVLYDPDRRTEAEVLLLSTRLSCRPLPAPPAGLTLESLPAGDVEHARAIAAARKVSSTPGGGEHNPFFVHGPQGHTSHLLAGVAHAARNLIPELRVAYLSGADLTAELLEALEAGYLDAWRRRYEQVDMLLLDGIEAIVGSQRVQETVLGLVEVLVQAGRQVVLGASAAPKRLSALDPRLLIRVESGLVLDLGASSRRRLLTPRYSSFSGSAPAAPGERTAGPDRWYFNREKVAWGWVGLGERVIEELG